MILGIGLDVADIHRFGALEKRFGERFTKRLFTPQERALAQTRLKGGIATYAKRFAAKEAVLKALGTGYVGNIRWQDMEILPNEDGAPTVYLTGEVARLAAEKCQRLCGAEAVSHFWISLSDTPTQAHAMVVWEGKIPLR